MKENEMKFIVIYVYRRQSGKGLTRTFKESLGTSRTFDTKKDAEQYRNTLRDLPLSYPLHNIITIQD